MITPDRFDELSTRCQIMTGRPWDGTVEHLAEAHARQHECIEILDAHTTWLSRTRARALDAGRDWTTAETRRQSRLDGDLTAPPEWLFANEDAP